jgi:hypothetical protein
MHTRPRFFKNVIELNRSEGLDVSPVRRKIIAIEDEITEFLETQNKIKKPQETKEQPKNEAVNSSSQSTAAESSETPRSSSPDAKKEEQEETESTALLKDYLQSDVDETIIHKLLSTNNEEFFELILERTHLQNEEKILKKKRFNSTLLNTMESMNNDLNAFSIFLIIIGKSATLTMESGEAAIKQASFVLDYLQYAFPAVLAITVLGGVIDTTKAILDSKTERRALSIAESLSRTGLGLTAFAISMGWFVTSPFAIPLIFLVITGGLIAKEQTLLKDTQKKIAFLEKEIKKDTDLLNQRIDKLNNYNDVNNDAKIHRLAVQIAENQQKLEVQRIQEKNFRQSRNALLIGGLASVTLLLVSAAFPPLSITALALISVGLGLFFAVNRYVTRVKTKAAKDTQQINDKSLDLAIESVIEKGLSEKSIARPEQPKSMLADTFFKKLDTTHGEARPSPNFKNGFKKGA